MSVPLQMIRLERRSGLAKKSADIAEMLLENKKVLGLSESSVRILEKSKTVNRKRERYISARNVMGIISLLTMLDCYTRFKAWAGDMFVVLRKR